MERRRTTMLSLKKNLEYRVLFEVLPRPSDPSGARGQGDAKVIGVGPRPLDEVGRRGLHMVADGFHGQGHTWLWGRQDRKILARTCHFEAVLFPQISYGHAKRSK